MGTHPIFESDFDCLTEKMADSDVSDIASPPSKKARQGDLISLFKNGKKNKSEIEKENKPENNQSEIIENENEPEMTEQEPEVQQPETPKSTKNRRPSINTPKSGKKRSREEIEANKAER